MFLSFVSISIWQLLASAASMYGAHMKTTEEPDHFENGSKVGSVLLASTRVAAMLLVMCGLFLALITSAHLYDDVLQVNLAASLFPHWRVE